MYIMHTASQGGRSYWASCGRIYNELVETRPHLISKLAAQTWPFQRYVLPLKRIVAA
jgi:hypothetical protein